MKQAGFSFQTETDTEVVLAAYVYYGAKCLDLFNGMFSFAIWDNDRKSLFCARDRLGIKPFYYLVQDNCFYFSSEVKALLLVPQYKSCPNRRTLYDYLSLGIMHQGQNAFFENIKQLEAGCYLQFNQQE